MASYNILKISLATRVKKLDLILLASFLVIFLDLVKFSIFNFINFILDL